MRQARAQTFESNGQALELFDTLNNSNSNDEAALGYINYLIEQNTASLYPFSWLWRNPEGCSFLHVLASGNFYELTQVILSKVKQEIIRNYEDEDQQKIAYRNFINHKSNDGSTALHFACNYAFSEITELLIQEGAEFLASIRNSGDSIPHLLATHNVEFANVILSKVKQEIIRNYEDEYQQKIAYRNFINHKNTHGMTPLLVACRNACPKMIELLIQEGADVFLSTLDHGIKYTSLGIAILNYTPEEPANKEKFAKRIETIKILLQHHAGFGIPNLAQQFKSKNIVPPVNAFAGVNVIASGFTRNHPGFELAICSVEEFITDLKESDLIYKEYLPRLIFNQRGNQDFIKIFDEKTEVLLGLCKKKLEESNHPMKDEITKFMRFLDFNRSGNLQRQCLRFIARNEELVSTTPELHAKLDVINILPNFITSEIESNDPSYISYRINQLKLKLDELSEKAQPPSGYASDYYSLSKVRNGCFAFSSFLAGSGLGALSFIGISTHPQDLSWAFMSQGEGVLALFLISFGVFLSWVVINQLGFRINLWCMSYIEEKFSVPFTDTQNLNFKATIQKTIDKLVELKVISADKASNFLNANSTKTIDSAIEDIKKECDSYLEQHPVPEGYASTQLYAGVEKLYFFAPPQKREPPQPSLIVEELDVELMDVVTDENTVLLGEKALPNDYGAMNSFF